MPLRKSADDLRRELERLRTDQPNEYARQSARLLRELEEIEKQRQPYAIT